MRQGLVTLSMNSAKFGAWDVGFVGGFLNLDVSDVLRFEKLCQGLSGGVPMGFRGHVERQKVWAFLNDLIVGDVAMGAGDGAPNEIRENRLSICKLENVVGASFNLRNRNHLGPTLAGCGMQDVIHFVPDHRLHRPPHVRDDGLESGVVQPFFFDNQSIFIQVKIAV